MARIELTPEEKEILSAYRAMQKALGIFVRHVNPSDPDRMVTDLTNSMDTLCRLYPNVNARTR